VCWTRCGHWTQRSRTPGTRSAGHYYGAQTGDDANARDVYREHPWFSATVEFCEGYDENCFDAGYDWLPHEHFALAVEEVFSREPAFR
jgi:hypothetical protein